MILLQKEEENYDKGLFNYSIGLKFSFLNIKTFTTKIKFMALTVENTDAAL